jgi:hypothetical protein
MTDLFSRRVFLKTTAVSTALWATCNTGTFFTRRVLADNSQSQKELLLLCGSEQDLPTTEAYFGSKGYLKVLDLSTRQPYRIDVPFWGHTANPNPIRPYLVAVFQKRGHHGGLVNLRDKTFIVAATPSDDNRFYGHCAFVKDGSVIVTSENSEHGTEGFLVVRDPLTLKIIDRMSSGGSYPHDCKFVESDVIVVVNEGRGGAENSGRPNLAWVSIQSGKIVDRIYLDDEPNVFFKHVEISSDNWICVAGYVAGDRGGARAVMISPDRQVKPLEITADMADELLSIAFVGKTNILAGTMALSDIIGFWDYKTQKLIAVTKIPKHPTGLLYDRQSQDHESGVIVSTYEGEDLTKINIVPEQEKITSTLFKGQFGGRGSHLARSYI